MAARINPPRNGSREPAMSLKPLREEIDQIDAELVRLLDRRGAIAREVGKSKAISGLTTFDPGRAKAVIQQAVGRSSGDFPREGMLYVFREVLSACLSLQKPLRVGYLGPPATFAHQAAIREFGSSVDFEHFEVIRDCFHAVDNGWVDYSVVPVENSTGGIIHDTLDGFLDFHCMICSEILLPIHHSLLANCAKEQIKRVFSHPQGFRQCADWLKEHLPDVERVEVASTVKGMIEAKKGEFTAAIGSEIGAEQYGLRVIARSIEDTQDNTTRFLVISRSDSPKSGDDKTSVMFSVADKPGALFHMLKPFADRGINMSKIESRPTKRKAWEYVFFVDALGHRTDPKIIETIEEVRQMTNQMRILGSYPREKTPSELDELQGRRAAEAVDQLPE